MSFVFEGFRQAIGLIARLDPEIARIALLSIKVSTASTLLATLLGVPVGFAVATHEFRGRSAAITLLNTLLSMPTVIVGLMVYSLLSRRGPLGSMNIMFTPLAMVIGQCILAFPIVAALSISAIESIDRRARATALTLGATGRQAALTTLAEGRIALLAAVITAFGRVFGEVGVSMMLGGNIRFYTRNIPTAIALETGRGDFSLALALGMILLAVSFTVNLTLQITQKRGQATL